MLVRAAGPDTRVTPKNFRIGALCAGDIVFVYARPSRWPDVAKRFINVKGQRVLAAVRKAEPVGFAQELQPYSHAMLGMGGGTVIHADGKKVTVDIIDEVLRHAQDDAARFRIYRRPDLTAEETAAILRAAEHYYNQKYRFSSYFTGQHSAGRPDGTQFCSRLIAHAYRAAGKRLTSLPDHRVLPLDLYRICQSPPWQDVSEDFIEAPPPADLDRIMGPIPVPGLGNVTVTQFFDRSDTQLRELARLQKLTKEQEYAALQNMLSVELQLNRYVTLQLGVTQQIRKDPQFMNDTLAEWTERVMQQLPQLLDLAELPTLDLLVPSTILNSSPQGQPDLPRYAGMPRPSEIRQAQLAREALRLYTYLMLGDIGMRAILAHYTGHEKFAAFQGMRADYAQRFLAAIPDVDQLDLRAAKSANGFQWAQSEAAREFCRGAAHTILQGLKLIDLMRQAAARAAAAQTEAKVS